MPLEFYQNVRSVTELKYITQENLDTASINVTSEEMYKEVDAYNRHAVQMRQHRVRFLHDMWTLVVLNIIVFSVSTFLLLVGKGSFLLKQTHGNLNLCFFLQGVLCFLFVFVILIRKNYSVLLTAIFLVPLIFINWYFAITAAATPFIISLMERIDRNIRNDIGYPHFVQLNTSYIRDEESEDDGLMDEVNKADRNKSPYTFDKYKMKADNDEDFLTNQDIFDDALFNDDNEEP